MKLKLFILSGLILFVLNSCAYNVQPMSAKPVNVYSSYEEKIPGKFVVVIDESLRNVSKDVRPSEYVCGAHHYPLNTGDALANSVEKTMLAVFDNVEFKKSMPTSEEMRHDNIKGALVVMLNEFKPKVKCGMGFWTGSCRAETEISLGIIARGPSGNIYSTAIGGEDYVDGDSGIACEGAANILALSIEGAMQETCERLGERLANSVQLREAALRTYK